MRTVSASLAAAIASPHREITTRVIVDWDNDGLGLEPAALDNISDYVGAVSIERTLTGDLPEQARVIEGSAAASATVDLAKGNSLDDRRTAAWWWSRLNSASPFASKERLARTVAIDVGFHTSAGIEYTPIFRGKCRGLPVSSRAGTARLTALDNRERMRARVQLPTVVAHTPSTEVITKPGLEATWLASYVLWKNGFYSSPPPRPGCRFWAPMHGSAHPFIGAFSVPTPGAIRPVETQQSSWMQVEGSDIVHYPMRFDKGPFVLGTATPDNGGIYIEGPLAPGDLMGEDGFAQGRLELWFRAPTFTPGALSGFGFRLSAYGGDGAVAELAIGLTGLSATTAQMEMREYGGPVIATGPVVTASDSWQFAGIAWDFAYWIAVGFRYAGITTVVDAATVGSPWPTNEDRVILQQREAGLGGLAEVQVSAGIPFEAPFLDQLPFVPTARIDRSAQRLDGIVSSGSRDSWNLLQELAAAEQASLFFDADGVAQYSTVTRLASAARQTAQAQLTADTSLMELDYDDNIDQIANSVAVTVSGVQLRQNSSIYVHGEKLAVPARSSVTLFVSLAGPAILLRGTVLQARTSPNGGGSDLGVNVSASVELVGTDAAHIIVRNAGNTALYLVDTNGDPAFAVRGDWIEQTEIPGAPLVDDVSVAGFGEQPLDIGANPWRQRPEDGDALARRLASDLARPRPYLTNIVIIGDPRLELGDRVRVQDVDGVALDGDYWITGIRDQIDADGGYVQTISARQARTTALWDVRGAWDDPNYMWGE